MARKYYTLCIREDGIWAQQFGDYDRMTVSFEVDCLRERGSIKKGDYKILTTGPKQADINAAVAALNVGE